MEAVRQRRRRRARREARTAWVIGSFFFALAAILVGEDRSTAARSELRGDLRGESKRDIAAPLPAQRHASSSDGVVILAPSLDDASAQIVIAAGTFRQGSDGDALSDAMDLCRSEPLPTLCDLQSFLFEFSPRWVTLSAYRIDRTEVTVGAYRRCVAAAACAAPTFDVGDRRFDRDDLPVTHVSWNDAVRYCAFRHARLPTEAEWERAARGLSSRAFPWGEQSNARLANHGALDVGSELADTKRIVHGVADGSDGFVGLAPVGSFIDGATRDGVLDLAGNVAEWVDDLFDLESGGRYDPKAVTNPHGGFSGNLRMVRGGSYRQPMALLRSAARDVRLEGSRDPDLGFRCASDAPSP